MRMSQNYLFFKAKFWKKIENVKKCEILKQKSRILRKKSNSEQHSYLKCIVGHVVYGQRASVNRHVTV